MGSSLGLRYNQPFHPLLVKRYPLTFRVLGGRNKCVLLAPAALELFSVPMIHIPYRVKWNRVPAQGIKQFNVMLRTKSNIQGS